MSEIHAHLMSLSFPIDLQRYHCEFAEISQGKNIILNISFVEFIHSPQQSNLIFFRSKYPPNYKQIKRMPKYIQPPGIHSIHTNSIDIA